MGLDSTFEKKGSSMLVLDSSARINDSSLTEAFEAAGQQRQAPSTDGTAEQLPPQIEAAACSSIGPKSLTARKPRPQVSRYCKCWTAALKRKTSLPHSNESSNMLVLVGQYH